MERLARELDDSANVPVTRRLSRVRVMRKRDLDSGHVPYDDRNLFRDRKPSEARAFDHRACGGTVRFAGPLGCVCPAPLGGHLDRSHTLTHSKHTRSVKTPGGS